MKTLDVQQGTQAWHEARTKFYRSASRAPAMMSVSPYQSRGKLLREVRTGLSAEHDGATLARFADGHAAEAAARPIAEKIIGQELFPATATDDEGYLSASFDGITILEEVTWECKLWSEDKAAEVREGQCPECDYWQVVQQLKVSGAERALYMVTDGTEQGSVWCWVEPKPEDFDRLMAGWRQFDADLAEYQPEEASAVVTGRAPNQLPALHIEVTGMVKSSNLAQFREHALAIFAGIKTNLQTDEDFADAEKTVKWCKEVEDRLKAAKDHALSQTESIAEVFRTIDAISAEARAKRLELDKLVKAQKDARRLEILNKAKATLSAHIGQINATLGGKVVMPDVPADFASAMKHKKTLISLHDAADTELARAKITANEIADRIRLNLDTLQKEAKGYEMLFADMQQLVATKTPEDLANLIKVRISEHKAPKTRPTDGEIIEVLSLHFRVHESKVIEWLLDMDLAGESENLVSNF